MESYLSGMLAIKMRCVGYDAIIMRCKAERALIISIIDNQVQLIDTVGLWRFDTYKTQRILQERYNN